MVVALVVNRLFVVSGEATTTLDDPTTYYLLHRNDFGLGDAPSGARILALSRNISDADLAGRLDILARGWEGSALSGGRRRRRGRPTGQRLGVKEQQSSGTRPNATPPRATDACAKCPMPSARGFATTSIFPLAPPDELLHTGLASGTGLGETRLDAASSPVSA